MPDRLRFASRRTRRAAPRRPRIRRAPRPSRPLAADRMERRVDPRGPRSCSAPRSTRRSRPPSRRRRRTCSGIARTSSSARRSSWSAVGGRCLHGGDDRDRRRRCRRRAARLRRGGHRTRDARGGRAGRWRGIAGPPVGGVRPSSRRFHRDRRRLAGSAVPEAALVPIRPLDPVGYAAAEAGGTSMRETTYGGSPVRVLSVPLPAVLAGAPAGVVQVVGDRTAELRTLGVLLAVLLVGGLVGAGRRRPGRVAVRDARAGPDPGLAAPPARVRGRHEPRAANAARRDPRGGGARPPAAGCPRRRGRRRRSRRSMPRRSGWATLVDDLLALARTDAGPADLDLRRVDLAEVATDALGGARAAGVEARVRLTLDVEPAVMLGDADRLRRLVTVLVDNAIRHGREGGQRDGDRAARGPWSSRTTGRASRRPIATGSSTASGGAREPHPGGSGLGPRDRRLDRRAPRRADRGSRPRVGRRPVRGLAARLGAADRFHDIFMTQADNGTHATEPARSRAGSNRTRRCTWSPAWTGSQNPPRHARRRRRRGYARCRAWASPPDRPDRQRLGGRRRLAVSGRRGRGGIVAVGRARPGRLVGRRREDRGRLHEVHRVHARARHRHARAGDDRGVRHARRNGRPTVPTAARSPAWSRPQALSFDPASEEFTAADEACKSILEDAGILSGTGVIAGPIEGSAGLSTSTGAAAGVVVAGGGDLAEVSTSMQSYAACMRTHGVDFPDPIVDEKAGTVQLQFAADPTSAAFREADAACASGSGPGFGIAAPAPASH